MKELTVMSRLGSLLSLNIGMHCMLSIGTDLLFAGRIASVVTNEDSITITNKLGAMYKILSVDSMKLISEQEVLVRHLNGTEVAIEVSDR